MGVLWVYLELKHVPPAPKGTLTMRQYTLNVLWTTSPASVFFHGDGFDQTARLNCFLTGKFRPVHARDIILPSLPWVW